MKLITAVSSMTDENLKAQQQSAISKAASNFRVILADDHELVRTGIRLILEKLEGFQVIDEAETGVDAISAVERHKPDLLILDIQMPNLGGMEVLNRLSKLEGAPKILVVSAVEPSQFAAEAFSRGAAGYLMKGAGQEEFEQAVKSIRAGRKYVSPMVAEHLVNPVTGGIMRKLSDREREVFMLLAEGKKNKEIAALLFISQRTIDTHRLNIMKKLGASTNSELTQIAHKNGVL